MKKILLIFVMLFSMVTYSQEIYTFKSGGRVFDSQNQKISPDDFRNLLVTNQPALELYETGRNKKTIGNVMLYGGISTLIGKFIYDISYVTPYKITQSNGPYPVTTVTSEESSRVLYYVGAGLVLVAIPIKIGFSKKIKRAIEMLNEDNSKPKKTSIETASFIINSNGIGLSITF